MDNTDFNFFCATCTKDLAYRKAHCFVEYRHRSYEAGEYITYKGHTARELSIVVRGGVTTEIILDSGIAFSSKPHSAPYPIGAIAIFSETKCYRADIRASEPCEVISVKSDDIESQMTQCRIFMRNFIAYGTQKIDVFSAHLNILSHKGLKSKLAFYILSLEKNGEFCFDKKIEKLARYLCVERPSLSRAISQLAKEGVITYSHGRGRVLSHKSLEEMLDREL